MCGQFYLYIKRESPFLENYSVLNFELVEIIFGKIFSIAIPEFLTSIINIMTSRNIDGDRPLQLAKFPIEIIVVIIRYFPKCKLPELLYFRPIRKEVASMILSNVDITNNVPNHKGSDPRNVGYSKCDCDLFKIKLRNLKKGIAQWNIFPRGIYIKGLPQIENVLNNFPIVLKRVRNIKGGVIGCEGWAAEKMFDLFSNSNIRLNCLELRSLCNPVTLLPIVTNVQLFETKLTSYIIPGVKKMNIQVGLYENHFQTFAFSSDLEDLEISTRYGIHVILPPYLRKINITTYLDSSYFTSDELFNLEYLRLELYRLEPIERTKIIAPNLKTLVLIGCEMLSNFRNSNQYPRLQNLVLDDCAFPTSLLNENSFPELETFEYTGFDFPLSEGIPNLSLILPSNLKVLLINNDGTENVNLNNIMLPETLTRLQLSKLTLDGESICLGDNLQYICIKTSRLAFESSFRIPNRARKLELEADYLTFKSLEFMYNLPYNLEDLKLIANKEGKLGHMIQTIKWPWKLGYFELDGFRIDYRTRKLLNSKETRLSGILVNRSKIFRVALSLDPAVNQLVTLMEWAI